MSNSTATCISHLQDKRLPDYERNEAANALRVSRYPGAMTLLKSIAQDESESIRMRDFAIQHMGLLLRSSLTPQDFTIDGYLESLTAKDHPTIIRREALYALAGDVSKKYIDEVERLLKKFLTDSNDRSMWDICLRIIYEQHLLSLQQLAAGYVDDPDPIVAKRAASCRDMR